MGIAGHLSPWTFLLALLLMTVSGATVHSQPAAYEKLRIDAEKLYAEGSYALAHQVYEKAADLELPPADKRWVDFRLADTQWRSLAAAQESDGTKLEAARAGLEVLVRDVKREEDRDRVWAEVQESLGDYWWIRRGSQNWGMAWQYYQPALDWWAGAKDIETARARYLGMVFKVVRPPQDQSYYNYYAGYVTYLPAEIVEDAVKIAKSDRDRAYTHYLLALSLMQRGGDWEERQRIPDEFEASLKAGRTDWYDDALYHYAEYLASQGRAIPLENGSWRNEPDYSRALELLQRLLREFQKGQSRYRDQAEALVQQITGPNLGISVSNIFLPGSDIQVYLSSRNLKQVDFALYRVDLSKDVHFANKDLSSGAWLSQIDLKAEDRIRSWSKETGDKGGDKGDHIPRQETIQLEPRLETGAYVLEARGGGLDTRELVLVTDVTVVLKSSGRRALAWVTNANDGSPVAHASVGLWERDYDGTYHWRRQQKETGADGVAVFDLGSSTSTTELFAGAEARGRQAFALSYGYSQSNPSGAWKLYAFTDRPAYRPGDAVQWKLIARQSDSGGAGGTGRTWSTPAKQTLEYELRDPRGAKIKDGKLELNAFGAAWDSAVLTENMPLGEYQVVFWDAGRKHQIGQAVLFRLEEYKLPEFKVSVHTPEVDGRKKTFRLGDKIEVEVQADYYFGGAVAEADVEVLVYQRPYYHYWWPSHDFPWFYQDMRPQPGYWGGQGSIIRREKLRTDNEGRAHLTFDTPRGSGQELEYTVEARVTDASRREIVGSDSVKVTRQPFYVQAEPAHFLYRPQDKVQVNFSAMDANDQPVQAEGQVKVTRDYWYEIWIDPKGKELKGAELKAVQAKGIFPPPPAPNGRPWTLKFQGYEHEDILTRTVKTDKDGKLELTFTPEREGYYRVAWSSPQNGRSAITTETTVWVATSSTTELGYRHGGLELIIDKDTVRAGRKAPVMLVTPTPERDVLFSVEGADLYSYQVVHMTGTAKLIELPIEQRHVPDIFLGAAMVTDRQLYMDSKQVVVPPVEHFLDVQVKADKAQYQPRDQAELTVTTLDQDGKPVQAEVALSLVDESIFYIQKDIAGDPRPFFFGTKRGQSVQTSSTFQQKSYALVVVKRATTEPDGVGGAGAESYGVLGGVMGGVVGDDRAAASAGMSLDAPGAPAPVMLEAAAPARERLSKSAAPMGGARDEAPMVQKKAEMSGMKDKQANEAPGPVGEEPTVQVRTDFRATALWQPDVKTGADGKASVKVKLPDTLTTWRATARAATSIDQFGIGESSTRTRQPLIVRLEAPRFFVVGDTVTISAVIHNNTETKLSVEAGLEAEGLSVQGWLVDGVLAQARGLTKSGGQPLEVPAGGEARADWQVNAAASGPARLKAVAISVPAAGAKGPSYTDAMEQPFQVYEHGIDKFVAKSGKLRSDDSEVVVKLDLPKERRSGSTRLTVQVAPSLAVTMLDALPYLADYPYGCTEQTLSRFLPAVITARTLSGLGLEPADLQKRMFGGIEASSADKTHPGGKKDLRRLDDMVSQGLARLYDFQHGDGGWGWWKPGDSDPFMTAYVLWGLTLAREANEKVRPEALERAYIYLDAALVNFEEAPDQQAWMLHALAAYTASMHRSPTAYQRKALENLWTRRDALNGYTRALYALSAWNLGDKEKARVLVRNLENGVKRDTKPDTSVVAKTGGREAAGMGTAHWGEDGVYWRWSDGGVEATAFALRALLAIDPQNALVEPVMNWLVKNRRGAQWSNTRDTAIVVLAMNDYLKTSGELAGGIDYEVSINGSSIAKRKIGAAEVLRAPSELEVDPRLLRDGVNEIRIVKSGARSLYFSARAEYFSLEEPVTAAGSELFVRRDYYKLVGRETLLKGLVYDREPLQDGGTVKSGERVEVVVTVEAKNNYEYLLFEDLKPAGLEAVSVQSGATLYARELSAAGIERRYGEESGRAGAKGGGREAGGREADGTGGRGMAKRARGDGRLLPVPVPGEQASNDLTGRQQWVYPELRDRKVALFVDRLPQGVWEIRYDLRAEAPGAFHALPVMGHAMYVPEIRANGEEVRLEVKERK